MALSRPKRRELEETSTQVEIMFTDALVAEGLITLVEAMADAPVDPSVDDERPLILLAVSDNGPHMTSGSTRKFIAPVHHRPALRSPGNGD
jgi:hypothetical protein